MKILAAYSVLALAGTTNAACDFFCPSGVQFGENEVSAPNLGTYSCDALADIAAQLDGESTVCYDLRRANSVCCPDDATGFCTDFCPSGIVDLNADSNWWYGYTCGELQEYLATQVLKDDFDCEDAETTYPYCCPADFVACNFCPSGIVDQNVTTDQFNADWEYATCGELAEESLKIPDDNYECDALKAAHGYCCPTDFDSCNFCPSGVVDPNADSKYKVDFWSDTTLTCGELAEKSLKIPDDNWECDSSKAAHGYCCPADFESCDFCPSGVVDPNADSSVSIALVSNSTVTCGELNEYVSKAVSEEDDECQSGYLESAYPYCCPADFEACKFCPSGVLDDSKSLVDSFVTNFLELNVETCGELAEAAASISENNEFCPTVKFFNNDCCPDDVGDGCEFCPEGIEFPDAVFDQDFNVSCAMVATLTKIAPPDACDDLFNYQIECCPSTFKPVCYLCGGEGLMGNPTAFLPGEMTTCSDLDDQLFNTVPKNDCSSFQEYYQEDYGGILSGVCGCQGHEPANLCALCDSNQELNETNANEVAPLLNNEASFTCEFVVNVSPFINNEELCSEASINESPAAKTFCCKDKESPSEDPSEATSLSSILGFFIVLIFTLF